ncbi:MAG TPA: zinc ribbon domain-containing protein [Candidatus Eremiobacteraceae bacterium]|nr:zinc ribbon domain-containing protein [Candidatus Eremiobacteraceae bacterium]
MPVYEYRCKSCGKTHEIEHGFNDKRPTECPSCGGELVRVFHPIGLVFKGSGFHKTDYGGASSRTPSDSKAADAAKSDSKPSDPKTSSDGSSSAKTSDSSPSGSSSPPKSGDSSSSKT